MKTCTGCKIEKPLTEFSKDKYPKDGLRYRCKDCDKSHHIKNKERDNKRKREYYYENKEKIIESHKIYREKNKEHIKNWMEKNKQKNYERLKNWRENNKENNNQYFRNYQKIRKDSDPLFKLKCNLRVRTYAAFKVKKWLKNSKTKEILGADYKTVFNHIESRFKNGMSWDNQGEWHIDHIMPLASANTEEELIKLCHYTNLQPLWAKDNFKKGSKIIACKL